MYFLKSLVVLLITLSCSIAYASDAEDIICEMTANNPEGIISVKEKFSGINPEIGIVRKEIVFVINDVKYTLWDIDIYNGDDLLRVFTVENTGKNDVYGSFDINTKTGELLELFSNNYEKNYNPQFVGTDKYKLTLQEANDIVALHINNIYMFLGLE